MKQSKCFFITLFNSEMWVKVLNTDFENILSFSLLALVHVSWSLCCFYFVNTEMSSWFFILFLLLNLNWILSCLTCFRSDANVMKKQTWVFLYKKKELKSNMFTRLCNKASYIYLMKKIKMKMQMIL